MSKITSSRKRRANRPHILFSELIAVAAMLLLASVALAAPNITISNATRQNTSTIILEDLQVQPVQPFNAQTVQPLQWLTVIDVDCGSCAEGENATFFVAIRNLAGRVMTVNSIILADVDEIVFGGVEVNSALAPNQTVTFPIIAELPPATRGRTLYYTPCFIVTDSLGGQSQQSCERSPRKLMLSGISIETMFSAIYILLAIVLLVIAVAYFALSRKLEDFEVEESAAPEQPSSPAA